MHVVWIVVGALIVVVMVLGARSFLAPAPPRDVGSLAALLGQLRASGVLDAATEVKVRELGGGAKLEAVKVLRTQTRVGLKDALDLVNAMVADELPPPEPPPAEGPPRSMDDEVRELVAAGERLRAVALVRERTGVALRDAVEIVDAVEKGEL